MDTACHNFSGGNNDSESSATFLMIDTSFKPNSRKHAFVPESEI